ncbi:RRM domain-containing protein [Chloropicon primus]|uniref:RRM domain-containing protein n=1 Tax=Chloropicon primus TaxID=1764295 RepID=A0A5B8MLD3_9CHLO|nr:hypothetical protein A3770_03p27200 [Chloropicon primus]UPQ99412.1 RRM domain-containing protein [Chloropicon primus]|eukprot:QDZ20202.1 hypothetical protein A3770_03p27200 [Chloropicon primus]
MGQKETEAEGLLRAKYALLREVSVQNMQTTRDYHLKYSRKRVTIKQPTMNLKFKVSDNEGEAPLNPLEKAKRVLAAEAKARAEAQAERKATLAKAKSLAGAGLPRNSSSQQLGSSSGAPTRLTPSKRPKRDRPAQATAPAPALAAKSATIYVSNLPFDCDEAELGALFERYGSISNMLLMGSDKKQKRESPGAGPGPRINRNKYCFVTFDDAQVARRIVDMSKLGKAPPKLRDGVELFINWSKEDELLGVSDTGAAGAVGEGPAPAKASPPKPVQQSGQGGADGNRNLISYDDDFL